MIKSKENRKLVQESIERWSEWTKVKSYLREGDVPALTSTIMEIFYHITLSCGHMVSDFDEEVCLTTKGQEDGKPAIYYGSYCKDCAEWYKKKKLVLHSKEEEDKYLNENP